MATQRKDDHLDRRIPESQQEGSFDRDLHRTLDLTIRQVNELEEKVDSFDGGAGGDVSGLKSRVSEVEESLSGLEDSVDDRFESVKGRIEELEENLELEARDEVFTEPIELRAGTTLVKGAGSEGHHVVEFEPKRLSFESANGTRPLSLSRKAAILEKARLKGESENQYADLWAGEDGALNIAPKRPDRSAGGLAPSDVVVEAEEILPKEPYETSLGSQRRKYQSIHAAELWVDSLVAQKKIATIGGSIFVGPTTELTQPLSGDPDDSASHPARDDYNYVRVKHNQMSPGDVVLMDNFTRVEFMRVVEGPAQIEAKHEEEGGSESPFDFAREHNYRYKVERDLDGSGANDWTEGAAVANTGRTKSGFIDLYATRSRRAENESGPSMAISVREEDKSTYGKGEWAPGTEYEAGDIVYWDADDWDESATYSAGDIVYYEPRGQHYIAQTSTSGGPPPSSADWSAKDLPADTNFAAQTAHTAAESDLPLSESSKWSEVEVTDYFNQWGERSAIGNLDGLYDFTGDVYGVAGGKYEDTWFSIDETQGFRLMNQDAMVGQWDRSGFVRIGERLGTSQVEPKMWRGVWQAGTDYMIGDVVQSPSDGLFYIAASDHTSGSGDSPISGSGKWVLEQHPVEIAPNGEMILRGTLRIPDGSGGFENPGIRWRGLWQPGVDYDQGDGVFYKPDGNTYVCEISHTSASSDEPIDEATDGNGNDLWSLVAEPANRLYLDTDGPRAIKNSMGTVEVIIRRIEGCDLYPEPTASPQDRLGGRRCSPPKWPKPKRS